MILVSACLLGVKCKYNGECNEHAGVIAYLADKHWIPICPEQLGGLGTPRVPAEIENGDGAAVLAGSTRVRTSEGVDVTAEFVKGAEEVLRIAKMAGAQEAILKQRSPSCGYCQIYDGTFEGVPRSGSGVTATLLENSGISVRTEEDFNGPVEA